MKTFEYFINLDERGSFNADVRTETGKTVYEIANVEELTDVIETGYMKNSKDLKGLKEYLVLLGIMEGDDKLTDSSSKVSVPDAELIPPLRTLLQNMPLEEKPGYMQFLAMKLANNNLVDAMSKTMQQHVDIDADFDIMSKELKIMNGRGSLRDILDFSVERFERSMDRRILVYTERLLRAGLLDEQYGLSDSFMKLLNENLKENLVVT